MDAQYRYWMSVCKVTQDPVLIMDAQYWYWASDQYWASIIDTGCIFIKSLGELCVANKIKRTHPTNPRRSKDRDPHIESTHILRAPPSILGPRVPVSMLGRPLSIMGSFQYGVQQIYQYLTHKNRYPFSVRQYWLFYVPSYQIAFKVPYDLLELSMSRCDTVMFIW